jgi:hypothetical protein
LTFSSREKDFLFQNLLDNVLISEPIPGASHSLGSLTSSNLHRILCPHGSSGNPGKMKILIQDIWKGDQNLMFQTSNVNDVLFEYKEIVGIWSKYGSPVSS